MDRLDAMSVLLAVVEAGSLSAASRRLGTPLATVSRKISELESHLKTKLLHRSTRQMTLTDAGRSYLDACRRIIEQVEEAEREAKGEYRAPRGDLTVTAPTVLGHLHLLPVVLEFLVAYPDIDLRLLLSDNILNLLEDRVGSRNPDRHPAGQQHDCDPHRYDPPRRLRQPGLSCRARASAEAERSLRS
jgi:DNA-binding transcriptional LysR family regulator